MNYGLFGTLPGWMAKGDLSPGMYANRSGTRPRFRRDTACAPRFAMLVLIGLACLSAVEPLEAIRQAGAEGKYTLICVWRDNKPETQDFRRRFAEVAAAEKARAVIIDAKSDFDDATIELTRKLQLERAPMPLVLAIAPNGAITKAFPKMPADGFASAFISPALASCLKAMQDNRMAVISIGSTTLPGSAETQATAQSFVGKPGKEIYRALVSIDPAAAAELFKILDLPLNIDAAMLVLLVPPGQELATFRHPVSMEQMDAALAKAMSSGCGPWCCQ